MIGDMGDITPQEPVLPELPDQVDADRLREFDASALEAAAAALQAAERATIAAMAPYDRQLREIRARMSELATERRRRERAAQVARRAGVREAAKSGGMPSLATALEAGEALFDDAAALQTIRAFLSTGGEVGFGFATRPGTIAFTDGRRQRQARTWGEARSLFAEGWEPGAPGIPGVRVHLAGSRVERVAAATEVVVALPDGPQPA
jgi:hypothetical protein